MGKVQFLRGAVGDATARAICYKRRKAHPAQDWACQVRRSPLYLLDLEGRLELRMDIGHEVKIVISKSLKIPVEQLTDETKLEDLGAESLSVIEMVFDLEETFDISISIDPNAESRSENFGTIGDISRAVKDLVDAKAAR
jgi:acyl carrier protein